MNEVKNKNISLPLLIVLSACVVVIITLLLIFTKKYKETKIPSSNISKEAYVTEKYKDNYYNIIKDDYSGEHDLQFLDLTEYRENNELVDFPKQQVMNYHDYETYCEKWGINKKYSDSTNNYLVFSYMQYGATEIEARLAEVEYKNNDVNLYIWDSTSGYTASVSAYVIVIPTKRNINHIRVTALITDSEFENIKKYGNINGRDITEVKKPIIYLYPTKPTNVTVELLNEETITSSYPEYKGLWKVLANPNGDLIDNNTGRKLYALYYENQTLVNYQIQKDGFVVKGSDSAKFLEEKLAILGLSEKEAEEFIIYWLPILEKNNYNYIRFATTTEINKNMPIKITPEPDTFIRVLMTYKGLDEPIKVEEQKLETPIRDGFAVVEWGATEIK